MTDEIGGDTFDVRDAIERFEELESDRADLEETLSGLIEDAGEDYDSDDESPEIVAARDSLNEWDGENGDEFKALESFLEEVKGNGGDEQWRGSWYPVVFVRDSYFTEFAQEEAESLGMVDSDVKWPYTCIDWDKAAEELQQDYTSVEFRGDTYWHRS